MRNALLPALMIAALFASTAIAASTTQPSTQAASAPASQPALSFPAWAMKAYPDDITRLMRFDRVKEAEQVGLKSVAELAKQPDKTPEYLQALTSLSHLYLAINRPADAQKYLAIALDQFKNKTKPGQEREMEIAHAMVDEVQSSLALVKDQPDRAAEYAISAMNRLETNLAETDLRVVDQVMEIEHFKIRDSENGPVPDAIRNFNLAIQIYTNQLGPNSAPVADVQMSRGYYYLNNAGNPAAAQNAFQRALTIRQAIYGENSEVASSLEALALLDAGNNRNEQALSRLRDARAMTLKVIGEDDPAVAGIDIEIAAVLDRSNGDAAEAERLLVKAAAVFEKYPEAKNELAQTLDMLAGHYRLQANDAKADQAHDRAEQARAQLKKHQDL
jgi:tetratricopeptide (TPR) repeat protein